MLDFSVEERTGLTGTATSWVLSWPAQKITVRELVGLKVREEIERRRYAMAPPDLAGAARLAGADVEKYIHDKCQRVIEAMSSNAVFLFLGDRQVTDLDEELVPDEDTVIEFVHLVP